MPYEHFQGIFILDVAPHLERKKVINPLFFTIIALFGLAYFSGWLINIGLWNFRKNVPSKAVLWLPVFAGCLFIAVDIYAFTIFPNGTPVIGLAILAALVHTFLFFGAILQARKLETHRCPACGRWMEVIATTSDGGVDEAYTVTTSYDCQFCGYSKTDEKKSIEGMGHVVPNKFIIGKREKDGDLDESGNADQISAEDIEKVTD